MSRLRLSVIGAGSWVVSSHLPQLARRADDVEFFGVCRHGGSLLEKIRGDWGFSVASEDHREVLRHGADVVIVASPMALHHEHALAALRAGAHVLVEKPFTATSDQARELVAEAERLDRHLLVSYGYNYRPMMVRAKEVITDLGGIGELENVALFMASGTRELLSGTGSYARAADTAAPDAATWTDPRMSGGGYAQAQLTHAIGLAEWLQPLGVQSVQALAASPLGGPVEQHNAAVLRLEHGGIGTITGASAHALAMDHRDQLQIRAVGSAGQFTLDVDGDRFRMYRTGREEIDITFPDGSGRYECDGPPHALVDLALGRPVENRSPGALGLATVAVLEALYASTAGGVPVTVRSAR
ncbi:Gfo/Idh/MocA family protein [Pseudonocardia sp. GCM10023141]|uniref:Gfo/Idh/MocA family protein n=1 Tax=Pseudonocardia sp. GCM10023141 TaxID=3252653 RepID=UPI003608E157